MNIETVIQKKKQSISLLLEYEQAKEFENHRVKYEVVRINQDWQQQWFVFDKNQNELYFGTTSHVLNWFKRRNIEPFACEVFVRKEYENSWYSKENLNNYYKN